MPATQTASTPRRTALQRFRAQLSALGLSWPLLVCLVGLALAVCRMEPPSI